MPAPSQRRAPTARTHGIAAVASANTGRLRSHGSSSQGAADCHEDGSSTSRPSPRGGVPIGLLPGTGNLAPPFRGSPECHATAQLAFPLKPGTSDRSGQMRLRTLVVALAVAAPLLALESRPAAAFGWCGMGWGSSGYGYSAPRQLWLLRLRTSHLRRSLLRPTLGLAQLRIPGFAWLRIPWDWRWPGRRWPRWCWPRRRWQDWAR